MDAAPHLVAVLELLPHLTLVVIFKSCWRCSDDSYKCEGMVRTTGNGCCREENIRCTVYVADNFSILPHTHSMPVVVVLGLPQNGIHTVLYTLCPYTINGGKTERFIRLPWLTIFFVCGQYKCARTLTLNGSQPRMVAALK